MSLFFSATFTHTQLTSSFVGSRKICSFEGAPCVACHPRVSGAGFFWQLPGRWTVRALLFLRSHEFLRCSETPPVIVGPMVPSWFCRRSHVRQWQAGFATLPALFVLGFLQLWSSVGFP